MFDFPAVIDSTILNNWKNCHQKSFRKDMQHWKPKGISTHLHAGAAFAKGLEATRRAFYEDGKGADESLGRGIAALTLAYGDHQPGDRGSEANKTCDRMIGGLEFYFGQWPLAGNVTPTKMPSGKYAIEFSFAFPLPCRHPVTSDPIIYSGRADMIADYAGGVYVEDDKTASQLGEAWTRQWELRSQFTGYCWAARESGIKVAGVLVRGVSFLKASYGQASAITYRSAWEIDRWLRMTQREVNKMVWAWTECQAGGLYEANPKEAFDYALDDACNNYGGCCFRDICKTDKPEEWLPMNFERRKWDPLERTETLVEAS